MKRLLVYLYFFINLVLIFNTYAEEIKIAELSKGQIVNGPIVISNKIKIPLPEGEWKVLENKTFRGGEGFNWMPISNIILVKSSNQDVSSFDEFVEFSLVKIRDKADSNKPQKKICGENRGQFILHKSKSKGNMFTCFISGVAKSSFLKPDSPLLFRYKEKTNVFPDRKMLFSFSSYSSKLQTGSKINFLHGSSLEIFANENQLDENNSDLIANLWSLKSIQYHQNFQNNMNFKEAHKFNLNDDYQNLENEYAKLLKKDPTIKTVKKETQTEKKKVLVKKDVSSENILPPQDLLEYENYEVNKYNVKFYKDGDWVRIGKKHLSPFESNLNFEYWGQFKDNKLTRLVETIWMKPSPAHSSESQKFFEEYTFQRQEYNSCVENQSYLAFELFKSNKANCFLVRSFNPKDEIYSPSNRITSRVNINHGPSIMRKYFDKNNIDLPNTMLRAEHLVYSMNFFYAYYEMKAVDFDGSSDKSKMLNKASVKKFIKQTAENHLDFQEELEIVDNIKLNLSKYIDVDIGEEIKIAEVKKSQQNKYIQKKVKEDKKITKVVSDKDKLKKTITTSEINFYKMKKGDYLENASIFISKNNKILLPQGVWQIARKKKISSWRSTDNVILVNQPSSDSPSFGEFIEISVTESLDPKWYQNALGELKKPCKKKYYYHEIQKTSGSGNTFSCFATGFAENKIFQVPMNSYNPWSYNFKNYLVSNGTLTKNILFSLSAYASGNNTKSKLISVIYGSSLQSISDKDKINIQNEKLIKKIWTKKTINFHNNFQDSMNFKDSHLVSLEDEYNLAEKLIADLSITAGQKQKVTKLIKKEKKTKEKLVVDSEFSEEQKKIADKKAKAEKKKKLAEKKIEEEEKKLVEKKAKEEAQNQKILSSSNIDTEITNDENSSGNKNFLEALAKKEVLEYNKKKIIRYECQQPWDLNTEDYRPLLDIYELDLEDRVLIGTHRYITDKEYTEERTYPILAKDKDRVLVRYDSPNGNFSTKFFFNYGTDQSIVAVDNSYKTQAKCVNRDYFVEIKVAKKKIDNLELSKKDLKALENAKKEALLAQKEIKEIEKEQKRLLAKQENILKKQKQSTETTKVAKLKIYKDPKKLNKSLFKSISKSKFKKYNATSTVSYLFFESSENYLISLELLYRAYDLNTDAEKIRSHISYMKESKSSENQRLKSTRQIVQNQSAVISSNIRNESIELTEQGRVYYAQSLPYALNAAIATYNLYHVSLNTINNVGNSGDIVFGILNNLNNVIGIAQILPQLPSYSKNMYKTTKLIITGAKTKKIKESRSTKKALDELDLEIS